ncbi:hypothetical protein CUJ84_Chr000897 [Rhizobium leguminosarum]|jgi:hypothetical protein|uniref:Uncharacterized protein n=1 Tax=Rhizobium leguminosarum TaxID=384 RepID=A0A2K9YZ76_RHILE|nr:hypothetical protein CUJ84_Chr000897 [Rhizobium leguminosarum]
MGSFQIGVEGEGGCVLDYARISLASSRLETNMVRFICIFWVNTLLGGCAFP